MKKINETVNKATFEMPFIATSEHLSSYTFHFHEEIEVLYIHDGSIIVVTDNDSVTLEKGDIFIVMPNQVHNLITIGHNLVSVIKLFPITNFTNVYLDRTLYRPGDEYYDAIYRPIAKLIDENYAKRPGFELAIVKYCSAILLEIKRTLPHVLGANTSNKKNFAGSKFMDNVNEFLEQNYLTDFSLEEIAGKCGYTKCYFSRLFKEISGINFSDYYTLFRLRKSIRLLKKRELHLEEISYKCGFSNVRSYSRAFTKYYNVSPGKYRKNITKKSK